MSTMINKEATAPQFISSLATATTKPLSVTSSDIVSIPSVSVSMPSSAGSAASKTTTTTAEVLCCDDSITKNATVVTKKQSPHWRSALSGACAGAVAKTAVAPVERVKLLMQLQGCLGDTSYRNLSAWQVASKIYQQEGVVSFWRGNVPNIVQQAGTSALNFFLMDYYKSFAGSHSLQASFLSGGLAGGTATTVLYPIQFLRTRLAADTGTKGLRLYPNGMRDAVLATYKVDGIRGLYQGYGIALVGVFLYRSLHLGGYDAFKTVVRPNMNWTEKFAAAQIVSLTAGTVCYPIDSIRRRLMMQAGLKDKPFANSIDAAYKIASVEGVRGFYRGLAPNLVRSLGAALLLVSYDVLQSL